MMKSLTRILPLAVTAALVSACGFEHDRNVIGPTGLGMPPASLMSGAPVQPEQSAQPVQPSVLGTWGSVPTASAQAITALPDPSACGNFLFTLTAQTPTNASGSFTATCPGGMTLSGTISGQLGGATIPLTANGSASVAGFPSCSFTLTGTGYPDVSSLRIVYTGMTCLGPVSGTTTLRQATPAASAPPPAPAPAPAPAPTPAPAPASPAASDPLLGCGGLVSGEPIKLIECIHGRLNTPRTAAGAFEVTKRVAWAYRSQGAGLLLKPGGENIVSWHGRSFAAARIVTPDGHLYKLLTDVPSTNGPSFQDEGIDPALVGRWVAPIDPNS